MSRLCIFLLMVDAAWVCVGLMQNRVMWAWIVLYWAILTVKNFIDWKKSKKRSLMKRRPNKSV